MHAVKGFGALSIHFFCPPFSLAAAKEKENLAAVLYRNHKAKQQSPVSFCCSPFPLSGCQRCCWVGQAGMWLLCIPHLRTAPEFHWSCDPGTLWADNQGSLCPVVPEGRGENKKVFPIKSQCLTTRIFHQKTVLTETSQSALVKI